MTSEAAYGIVIDLGLSSTETKKLANLLLKRTNTVSKIGGEVAIVGNTISMELNYMDSLMEKVSGVAAEKALEKYKEEKMKDEKLDVKGASDDLGVCTKTLVRYIVSGKSIGGRNIKLKGLKVGSGYSITRLDLEEFKTKIEG